MKLIKRKNQLRKDFKELGIKHKPSKFEEGISTGLILTSKRAVRVIEQWKKIKDPYARWYFLITDNENYLFVVIGLG